MKSLFLAIALLLTITVEARAVVDWDEGFEYAGNTVAAMYGNMTLPSGPWDSSCGNGALGNSVVIAPSIERAHSGTHSLKETFRGLSTSDPGYQSCWIDRLLNSPTTSTLYTRFWMYIDNLTIGPNATKITLTPMYSGDAYTTVWWGMNNSPKLDATLQRTYKDPLTNDEGQNYYGIAIPTGQWACIEARLTYGSPGQRNGIVQGWVNGNPSINITNALMDQVGQQSVMRGVRLYTQLGLGAIYYDDYAVSRDARIGCAAGSGGSGAPLPDTSPPNPPTDLNVTELWNGLKRLVATVWQWIGPSSVEAAVPNDTLMLSWTSQQAGIDYDLRWQYFAHPDWIALGLVPSNALQLIVPLSPPVTCLAGADCYVCADARAKRLSDGVFGPWLSETPAGKACNQFAVGPIVLPPPPEPVPVPAPVPAPDPAPATVTMSGDTITIQCDKTRYTRMKTTGTGTKRVITCLK